ncbi:MAG TPA: hypothetical protein VK444_06435 [Methanobacteriaceae archaeon]|nr:hypothetical protein [Methanobacteriaceae archaeon]
MPLKYLEKDQKRIEKKMEELNEKLQDMEHENELKILEKKYESLKDKTDLNDQIWSDIYRDVLELEKKVKK